MFWFHKVLKNTYILTNFQTICKLFGTGLGRVPSDFFPSPSLRLNKTAEIEEQPTCIMFILISNLAIQGLTWFDFWKEETLAPELLPEDRVTFVRLPPFLTASIGCCCQLCCCCCCRRCFPRSVLRWEKIQDQNEAYDNTVSFKKKKKKKNWYAFFVFAVTQSGHAINTAQINKLDTVQ